MHCLAKLLLRMRISLSNNLKLAINPNPLGLKYRAVARVVSFLKNLTLVEQKLGAMLLFIFLVGKETPDANMKHKYPLMLTGYRSVQSFTVYTFSVIEYMF